MKKLLLSLVLVLTSIVLFAQGTYKEVVYLNNGSIIKGVIIEQVPNESIKIQTADGSVFVYPMSEIQKITKEMVEPEKPAMASTPIGLNVGKMERDGRCLVLDGRELSDEEVLALVGKNNYETYLGAKRQITTGRVFTPIFWVSFGATVGLITSAYIAGDSDLLLAGYITGAVADVSLPLMIIFKSIGKGRMNWVASEYNKQNKSGYSFNISPAIMSSHAQPEQASLGVGMTFSLNF